MSDTSAEPRRTWPTLLRLALWSVAAAILAGWLALAVVHVHDDYRVTHYQGVWIAVSQAAREGHLYPAIFDGEHYAGTRYMPLPILMNALAARAAGDPLVGGKALAALLMGVLLVLLFVTLRAWSCPAPLAAALSAMVVATDTGLQAGTSIGGDLLPVVLQVGALGLAVRARGRSGWIAAGVLAGLAMASKLTGFWALLAVATWYVLQRQWRSAIVFSVACVATAAIVLGAVQIWTGGGLSSHLLAFAVAGVHGPLALLRGPNQILFNLLGHAWGAVVLVPLAAMGLLLPARGPRLSIVHLALGYAAALLVIVYADLGTGPNQLLDVVTLTALAAGVLAGRAVVEPDRQLGWIVTHLVAVTVIWAAGLDLVRTVGFDVRRSASAIAAGAAPRHDAASVAKLVHGDETVLSEDPSVPVALGRRPVVMDPFTLLALDRQQPQLVDPLISRIVDQRFDVVVLLVPLDADDAEMWYTDFHFGARIAKALRHAYVFGRRVGRYVLYRRAPGTR